VSHIAVTHLQVRFTTNIQCTCELWRKTVK